MISSKGWIRLMALTAVLIGVMCIADQGTPSIGSCGAGMFQCTNKCVEIEVVCDGWDDCEDKSDEANDCYNKLSNFSINSWCVPDSGAGGVKCECASGFQGDAYQRDGCKDIDECSYTDEETVCSQTCRNTDGSYTCSCVAGYELAEDRVSCSVSGSEPLLFLATPQSIFSISVREHRRSVIIEHLNGVQDIAVDNAGRIFWTESDKAYQPAIYVADIEHAQSTKLRVAAFGLKNPHGLAFDPNEKNLYVTDKSLPAIIACRTSLPHHLKELSTTAAPSYFFSWFTSTTKASTPEAALVCVTVYQSPVVNQPTDIVLDHIQGILYWIESAPKSAIVYASAEGLPLTDHKGSTDTPGGLRHTLATCKKAISLSLDQPTKRLYWIDSERLVLESIRLDGKNRQVVQSASSYLRLPKAMEVFESKAYWSEAGRDAVMVVDYFKRNKTEVPLPEANATIAMTAYHQTLYKTKLISGCMTKACDHVCLEGPGTSGRCECSEGLDAHRRHFGYCEKTGQVPLLLGVHKYSIVSTSLGMYSALNIDTLQTDDMTDVISVTYLPVSQDLLFVNDETHNDIIYRLTNTTDGHKSEAVVINAGLVHSLAVDEPAGLLYWVDIDESTIEVASLDGHHRSRLPLNEHVVPSALALDITNGVLYVVDLSHPVTIESCHQDGRDCIDIVSEGLYMPHTLVLWDDDLYWIDSYEVWSINVHTQKKTLHIWDHSLYPTSIAPMGDFLFWTNPELGDIYYLHTDLTTEDGHRQYPRKIEGSIQSSLRGLVVAAVGHYRGDGHDHSDHFLNKCVESNGGCEHICVPGLEGITCLCSDGFALMDDNKSCVSNRTCSDSEMMCDTGECILHSYRCDGDDDCEDGSDEHKCTPQCKEDEFYCNASRTCIINDWKCDGELDCEDPVDELDCNPCSNTDFYCKDGTCIGMHEVCDDYVDCYDASDELECHHDIDCAGQFQCGVGGCVNMSHFCDGVKQCKDGSDENCEVTCSQLREACSHDCRDTRNGPECICPPGYRLFGLTTCVDIDECQRQNGGCSQMCQNLNGSHQCYCKEGFHLEADKTGCKAEGERPKIFIGTDNGVRMFHPNSGSVGEMVLESAGRPHTLDVNAAVRSIYYSISKNAKTKRSPQERLVKNKPVTSTLFKSTISLPTSTNLVLSSGSNTAVEVMTVAGHIRGTVIDWISGNVFLYIEREDKTIVIMIVSPKDEVATLINEKSMSAGQTTQGLAVHPGHRSLFWLNPPYLKRACSDGHHKKVLFDGVNQKASALSIDYVTDRLYWADVSFGHVIKVSNLDGSSRYTVREIFQAVRFMDVFEGLAYISLREGDCVERLHLYQNISYHQSGHPQQSSIDTDGPSHSRPFCHLSKSFQRVHNPGPIRITHALKQPTANNPCDTANCSSICVPTEEGIQCLCPDDHVWDAKNLICKAVPCEMCLNNGHCYKSSRQTKCICKDGFLGERCEKKKPAEGNNSDTLIILLVLFVTSLVLVGGVLFVVCQRRKRERATSPLSTVLYKNLDFSGKKRSKESWTPSVTFKSSHLQEAIDEECDSVVDKDWWKKIIERSRTTMDTELGLSRDTQGSVYSIGGKTGPRSITVVHEEEDEEEERNDADQRVPVVGRMPRDESLKGDPQCWKTCDRARLLM